MRPSWTAWSERERPDPACACIIRPAKRHTNPQRIPRRNQRTKQTLPKHDTETDGCISCGLCADEFPELFHLNDEGVAEAVPSTVASDQEEAARQAANDCPVGVIVISE